MKFLCLAYGRAKDWHGLTSEEQEALLAQDEVLRRRGDLVAAVQAGCTSVRAWDGRAEAREETVMRSDLPLAGFGIVEAADMQEAVRLMADTPCARARGVVEIWPIAFNNAASITATEGEVPLGK